MTDAIEATRVCIDAAIKDGRVNDAWNMAIKHAQMVKLAAVEQSNKIVATMRAEQAAAKAASMAAENPTEIKQREEFMANRNDQIAQASAAQAAAMIRVAIENTVETT